MSPAVFLSGIEMRRLDLFHHCMPNFATFFFQMQHHRIDLSNENTIMPAPTSGKPPFGGGPSLCQVSVCRFKKPEHKFSVLTFVVLNSQTLSVRYVIVSCKSLHHEFRCFFIRNAERNGSIYSIVASRTIISLCY